MSETSSQTAIEEWVVHSCQALGLIIETADDDFFEAGATSLTVMRLISRADEKFGADALSPEDIVESSGVRAIAAAIAGNIERGAVTASEH
jgi:acyl carrier protein